MEVNKLIAIVRIRGLVNVKHTIADTMKILKLFKKNYCVIVPSTSSLIGMMDKIKDYVTMGEIDEATLMELLQKRGRVAGNKRLTADYLKSNKLTFESLAKELLAGKKRMKDVPGAKSFFRLSPPRGGFERKGIKHSFSAGGVLGYRKAAINDLIRRML